LRQLKASTSFYFSDVVTGSGAYNKWFSVAGNSFTFRVKASAEFSIAFSAVKKVATPLLEISVGNADTTSFFSNQNWAVSDTQRPSPGIWSSSEFRGFWVKWTGNLIKFGREGEAFAFLVYENPNPFAFNFIGIRGAASWSIDEMTDGWVSVNKDKIPTNALIGGRTGDEFSFIGRASYKDSLLPGKLVDCVGLECHKQTFNYRRCSSISRFDCLSLQRQSSDEEQVRSLCWNWHLAAN